MTGWAAGDLRHPSGCAGGAPAPAAGEAWPPVRHRREPLPAQRAAAPPGLPGPAAARPAAAPPPPARLPGAVAAPLGGPPLSRIQG